ncbi:MAG: cytochrome c3 family protein [Desulfovibrio sp.]
MELDKRFYPVTLAVCICLLVSAWGYFVSTDQAGPPARIALDNKGGRVLFTHELHTAEYGSDCTDCHHDEAFEQEYVSCGKCHPAEADDVFFATHMNGFTHDESCRTCHDEIQGRVVDMADLPDRSMIITRMDAFHSQCMDCHESMGAGPYGDDSCNQCHAAK